MLQSKENTKNYLYMEISNEQTEGKLKSTAAASTRTTLFRWRTPKDDAVSLKKPNPRLPRMNDEPVWLFQLSRLSRL